MERKRAFLFFNIIARSTRERVVLLRTKTVRSELRSVCGRRGLYSSTNGSGSLVTTDMTFRTKGHHKQQRDSLQQLNPNNNHQLHRDHYDKTDQLPALEPQLDLGNGPTAVTVAAVPTAVARPDAGGICTAHGPRCHVVHKVSGSAYCAGIIIIKNICVRCVRAYCACKAQCVVA